MRTLLLSVLCAASAHAEDYFVAPGGDDGDTGLTGHPWANVQRAFDGSNTVGPGDTVTVEDGSYLSFYCDGVSGTADAPIVVRARNRWGAAIATTDPTAPGYASPDRIQLSSCSFVIIDGFEVTGAARSGIAILGNTETGDDARGVIIRNNWSHDNGGTSSAGRHDGVFSGFALDLTIEDNLIHGTGEHGIYVSNAADNPIIRRNTVHDTGSNCIQINADLSTGGDGIISNWRIEGNVVSNCHGSAGFNLDGVAFGIAVNNVIYNADRGGITLFQGDGAEASHDNLIVANTVYDPAGSRAAIQIADGANNNVLFDNIFISAASGIEEQSVTGFVHDYNIVSSYDGATASAHESSPAAAGLFVGGDDLHLAAGSAAIDCGTMTLGGGTAPNVDVESHPRPQGAEYDCGAYEFGDAAPVDGGVAPSPDAGVRRDGGPVQPGTDGGHATGIDAGRRSDAGTGPMTSGGCGCRIGAPAAVPSILPIAIFVIARRRRSKSCA